MHVVRRDYAVSAGLPWEKDGEVEISAGKQGGGDDDDKTDEERQTAEIKDIHTAIPVPFALSMGNRRLHFVMLCSCLTQFLSALRV